MQTSSLHRFSIFWSVATLFLLVAGGLVVSNEAGLSVPDWPLSYGKVMPPMEGGVFYEHGHRMVATGVGILTIVVAVWLQLREKRTWLKRLGWAALAAVIFQGILGGLTVLFLLPKAISIAHACLAQLFFSTTVAVALFTSRSWQQQPPTALDSGWPSMRSLAVLAPLLVLAQVALGAGFRHKAMGIIPHLAGALVVTLLLLYYATVVLTQYSQILPLRRNALALMVITIFQVLLGIAAYFSRLSVAGEQPLALMVSLTVAHVAAGALTLALTVTLGILTLRLIHAPAEANDAPQAAHMKAIR